jgi:glycosyltransferase 2 family protein
MLRLLRLTAGLLVSIGLLSWAMTRADLGKIRDIFAEADLRWAFAAVVALILSHVVVCHRLSVLIAALGVRARFPHLLAVHFLGLLYNSLVPAQLGLDTARVQFGATLVGSRSKMLVLALADRMIGTISLALIGSVACVILGLRDPRLWGLAAAPAVVLAGAAALVLAPRLLPATTQRILVKVGGWGRFGPRFLSLVDTAVRISERPGHVLAAIAVAGLQVTLFSTALGVLSTALGLPAPVALVALACPLIGLVTMLVPISINGIGVREAMFCATTIPLGLDQTQALALSFGWFALSLVSAIPGLLGWVVLAYSSPGPDGSGASVPAVDAAPSSVASP